MAVSDCFVSVVAPLRNDADILEAFVKDLVGVLEQSYAHYEVVLVDDGSTDDTFACATELLATRPDVRILRLSRSFGLETAITAGLESVIGDYVVVMLPDTDPPKLIPDMVDRSRAGAGIVVAVRQDTRPESELFLLCSRVFHWYVNRFLKLGFPQNSAHFRVLNRKSVNALIQIKDHLRYIRSFSAFVGYGTEEFPYVPIQRRGTVRKQAFRESVSAGINVIVANSTQPLRLMSLLALTIAALMGLSSIWELIQALRADHPLGLGSIGLWLYRFSFVIGFLIAAVLCEYVGRILVEIQDRPLYFVAEEKSGGSSLALEERKNVVESSQS